ncbi:hypothetical protein DFH06DRAFT_1387591 [Mycena polygramma]|nr:hypothetical protein DFH06DRAFT_1387591 [Mycena polygramma]
MPPILPTAKVRWAFAASPEKRPDGLLSGSSRPPGTKGNPITVFAGKLIVKLFGLGGGPTIKAGITPGKAAYSQCPAQTGMPETPRGRRGGKPFQKRNMWKVFEDDDTVTILQSQVRRQVTQLEGLPVKLRRPAGHVLVPPPRPSVSSLPNSLGRHSRVRASADQLTLSRRLDLSLRVVDHALLTRPDYSLMELFRRILDNAHLLGPKYVACVGTWNFEGVGNLAANRCSGNQHSDIKEIL